MYTVRVRVVEETVTFRPLLKIFQSRSAVIVRTTKQQMMFVRLDRVERQAEAVEGILEFKRRWEHLALRSMNFRIAAFRADCCWWAAFRRKHDTIGVRLLRSPSLGLASVLFEAPFVELINVLTTTTMNMLFALRLAGKQFSDRMHLRRSEVVPETHEGHEFIQCHDLIEPTQLRFVVVP